MDKRGFLFTIISLIMLISILAFVIAYQNRIKELQDADTVNILRYYEDDIVSNSYSDLMDINVVNISKKTNTLVNFSSLGKYALDRDNQGIMNNYRNFIIDNYSRLNNINISMDNFVPEFYVKPYNSKFSLGTGSLTVLNPNYTQIQRINIDVTVNETLDAGTAVIPSADPGKITINVRFIRRSSKEILYSQEKDQDPTEVNPEFKLPFRSDPPNPTEVSSVSVKFGNYGTDGMLMISTSSLEGEITRFEIYYDNSDSRTIIDTGANLKINDKSSDIILAQQ
ncbi:hypothetical protein J4214_05570 [Candidatus Woesearchaeota archaeon]|nr:hypothetical protein [Candidatus Woesearchaeota archaeon]